MRGSPLAVLALVLGLCVGVGAGLGAQELDGQAIWDETVAIYANARTYTAEGSTKANMGFYSMSGRAEWAYSRDGRFMMSTTMDTSFGDLGRRTVVCDGRHLYDRMEITNEYRRKPAPPDFVTFIEEEMEMQGMPAVTVGHLLAGDDCAEKIEEVRYVRSGRYYGTPVHIVDIVLAAEGEDAMPGMAERMWIGQEDSLIYKLDMEFDMKALMEDTMAEMSEEGEDDEGAEHEGDEGEDADGDGDDGPGEGDDGSMDEMMDAMFEGMIEMFSQMEMGATERYRNIRIDDELAPGTFSFHARPGEKKVRVLSEPEVDEEALEAANPFADIDTDMPDFDMPDPDPSALLGTEAPDFTLTGLDGETVTLSDLRGKPVLIDFWASWCGPCQMELPHIQELHEEYADKGLQVVGISGDFEKQDAINAVEEMGLTFTVVWQNHEVAADMAIDEAYGVTAIPRLVLLDADGIVVEDVLGYHEKPDLVKMLGKAGL